MVNHEALQEYSNKIKTLKELSKKAGLNEAEFKKLYHDSLGTVINSNPPINRWKFIIKYYVLPIMFLILIFFACNLRTIYSCLVCNLQEYIYPGLRILRRMSIPLISMFPSLTEYYHETCLIQNPFFTVVDMDCWPCSTVSNVREIYNPSPNDQQQSAPFIYETSQQVLNIKDLKDLYIRNKELFDTDSPKLLANNKYHISVHDMFHNKILLEEKNLYIWKLNSMNMARILRQVIPRPKVVPKFGQSTERFLIIDSSQDSFRIPDTECSSSFLLSLSGTRDINLIPAEECKHQCKLLKIKLKETYLLWYNWWYWRPTIQPSDGNVTFVAHVGSYC